MYYEDLGNPSGIPVVLLHGGPGGGMEKRTPRFFDKRTWRVIVYDQRGCGKSTPRLSLSHNTTWDLVEDMERLRKHLEIPKWALCGGSWGSTLALAYADKHLDRITGFLLRGICLITPEELRWIYEKGGASQIYPDNWKQFIAPINRPKNYKNLTRKYKELFKSRKTRTSAAKAWQRWEGSLARHKQLPYKYSGKKFSEEISIIENHYFVNNAWLAPGQLLAAAKKIRVPMFILQGRYDMVCPVKSALDLKEAVPHATLLLVSDGGHSTKESTMRDAFHGAIRALAKEVE